MIKTAISLVSANIWWHLNVYINYHMLSLSYLVTLCNDVHKNIAILSLLHQNVISKSYDNIEIEPNFRAPVFTIINFLKLIVKRR